jgi:hypothetical protein
MISLAAYLLFFAAGALQSGDVPLFDFVTEQRLRGWYVVTDGVMGGGSKGSVVQGKGKYAVFSGQVSGAGGFASLWSRDAALDLSKFAGLTLRLRGDGKSYRVAAKNGKGVDAIQYMMRVTPARSGWSLVRVRFDELVPMFRGEILKEAPRFNPGRTMAVGVMIADGQEGPFELMIERVSAYVE